MEKVTVKCAKCECVYNCQSPYYEYVFQPVYGRKHQDVPRFSSPTITLRFGEAKDFKLMQKYFLQFTEGE